MPPLPPVISSGPMINADFQFATVGLAAPRMRSQAYITPPATTKRIPPTRNGGTVSMAKRMKRYVDPHIR